MTSLQRAQERLDRMIEENKASNGSAHSDEAMYSAGARVMQLIEQEEGRYERI